MKFCQQHWRRLYRVNMQCLEMKAIILTAILLCGLGQEEGLCPAWYRYNMSTKKCECVNSLSGALLCRDPGTIYLRIGYCMTLDNQTNMLIAGSCHRGHYDTHHMIRGLYGLLPNDSSQIMESQCQPNNRKGLLCAKCSDGYGVSVTSLTPKCVRCSWSLVPAILLYFLIELLPITIFFIIIVIFRLNISVGPLLGYFIYCQAYATTTNQLFELHSSILKHSDIFMRSLLYISYTLSSIWALCPFNIVPSICISPKISSMDAVAMKYIRFFYPLVLTLFTYFLIELHTRNFKPVVYLWKPIHACLRRVNVNSAINDSVIHAFATLYLLSFSVLNYISYKLLNVTDLIREDFHPINTKVQIDPTVSGYSPTHIPYAIATYVILLCFGVFPALLLCLYPLAIFQHVLACIVSQRRRITLNIFVETLQSFYKDGLNGTRDYRSASGLFLWATIALVLYNANFEGHWNLGSLSIVGFSLLITSITVAYVQPLKSFLANLSISFHTAVSCMTCVLLIGWIEGSDDSIDARKIAAIFAVLNFLPHFLVALWIAYKALSQIKLIRNVLTRGLTLVHRINRQSNAMLSRRLVNLERYDNL